VVLSGIQGDANVTCDNGSISVNDVAGAVELRGSFAKVSASKVQKGARIVAQNAPVSAADVGGATFLKTSFGLAEASRIGGDLTVENSNGAVKASAVKGGVGVRTSFGSVWLDDIAGRIDVDDSNGSIEVRAAPAASCAPIELKTSFGGISVRVPEGAGYTADARTSFGKIKTDFALSTSGSMTTEAISGRIGDGKCPLRLTNSNGGIEILKAK
jgi:DUF4097 and DUF4098 domain-containing protein YvlB